MNGDPIAPIPFERAIRQLWERFAGNAGIDLQSHLTTGDAEELNSASYVGRGQELQRLWAEADLSVWGLVVMSKIGAWVAEGDRWRRVPPEAVRDRLNRPADEPWGLYLDGAELTSAQSARWPEERGRATPTMPNAGKLKRGRPAGSGSYAGLDAPLIKKMDDWLKTQQVKSLHEASIKAADEAAGGGSQESRARRLRDRYKSKGAP